MRRCYVGDRGGIQSCLLKTLSRTALFIAHGGFYVLPPATISCCLTTTTASASTIATTATAVDDGCDGLIFDAFGLQRYNLPICNSIPRYPSIRSRHFLLSRRCCGSTLCQAPTAETRYENRSRRTLTLSTRFALDSLKSFALLPARPLSFVHRAFEAAGCCVTSSMT